jgi:hypothetical protein
MKKKKIMKSSFFKENWTLYIVSGARLVGVLLVSGSDSPFMFLGPKGEKESLFFYSSIFLLLIMYQQLSMPLTNIQLW